MDKTENGIVCARTQEGWKLHNSNSFKFACVLENYIDEPLVLNVGEVVKVSAGQPGLQNVSDKPTNIRLNNKLLCYKNGRTWLIPSHILTAAVPLQLAQGFDSWAGVKKTKKTAISKHDDKSAEKNNVQHLETFQKTAMYPTMTTKRALALIRGLIFPSDYARVCLRVKVSRSHQGVGERSERRAGSHWALCVTTAPQAMVAASIRRNYPALPAPNYTITQMLHRVEGCAIYRQDGLVEVTMHVPRGNEINKWHCGASDKVVERTMRCAYGTGDEIGAEVVPTGCVKFFKNNELQAEVKPTCPRPWVFGWETCHASKAEIVDPPIGLPWSADIGSRVGVVQQVLMEDI